MPRKKLILIPLISVIVIVVGSIAVGKFSASGAVKSTGSGSSAVAKNKTSVKVLKAKMSAITSDASFNATLESSKEGIVSSKVGGKVIQILFDDGQTVTQGQALAKLDDTDIKNNIRTSDAQLAAAQSQLNSAQVSVQKVQLNLENVQRNYNRQKALYEQQIISKSELENAELSLKSAQVDLQTSQAGIAAQQASVQAAETNLSILSESLKNTTITAPITGVMSGKSVNIGQFINVGAVLGKVENVFPIYADISVNSDDLSYIKVGGKVEFILDGDSQQYNGAIKNIDAVADAASRSFNCKIEIQNKEGKLKPGIFGKVDISANSGRKSITLPVQTLGGSEGEYYVFLNSNGVARKQAVTTGEILENTVEIKSGVKSGDSVICSNVASLQDGDAVQAVAE